MKRSCGIILHDHEKFLIGHVTGQVHWDIPKGGIHLFENELQCAVREFHEETGFDAKKYITKISPLGRRPYQSNKDLFMFELRINLPPIQSFHCKSMCLGFDWKFIPELDKFQYVTIQEAKKFLTPNMYKVLLSYYPGGKF
jgi:8-oxo-dGTP pyrophosphatase MutT (NUDIX family)